MELKTVVTTSSYRFKTDFFLYDGDYLRLKNLQIGYNIPTDSLPIDGLRLFFNNNLLTFTSIPLVDPEQRSGAATIADPDLQRVDGVIDRMLHI